MKIKTNITMIIKQKTKKESTSRDINKINKKISNTKLKHNKLFTNTIRENCYKKYIMKEEYELKRENKKKMIYHNGHHPK